jgi:hypothetical protein
MKDTELKLKFNPKHLFKKIADFFVHKSTFILFMIGFIFLGYVVLIWYQNIYKYEWDEVKKQEYMNNKNAGTNLNRVKFEKALKDIERRRELYDKNMENMKDIFKLEKKESTAVNAGEKAVANIVEKGVTSNASEQKVPTDTVGKNVTPIVSEETTKTAITENTLPSDVPKKTE